VSLRGELRREARADAKFEQYMDSGFMPWPAAKRHGCCTRCNVRGMLTMPLRICDKRCMRDLFGLVWAAARFGVKL
jgi:hypothetical protein